MEKNCILNQSLTQSPSLFDSPGTKAFTLENEVSRSRLSKVNKQDRHRHTDRHTQMRPNTAAFAGGNNYAKQCSGNTRISNFQV